MAYQRCPACHGDRYTNNGNNVWDKKCSVCRSVGTIFCGYFRLYGVNAKVYKGTTTRETEVVTG